MIDERQLTGVFSLAPPESLHKLVIGQERTTAMMTKLMQSAMIASVALTGIAATPATAQRYYPGDRYQGYERSYDDGRYAQRDYRAERRYHRQQQRRDYRNDYRDCRSSGTTGTIIGAIAGGLLGREIGRGGRYNDPSTTGLILGAGAGALAGRAIDRNGSCR